MATATVNGKKHLVRVTQDLTDNWAVEVYPEPDPGTRKTAEPFKNWPVELTMKVKADTREDALVCCLEQMKKVGKISDFVLEASEHPKPKVPRGAKAATATSEDADAEEEETDA